MDGSSSPPSAFRPPPPCCRDGRASNMILLSKCNIMVKETNIESLPDELLFEILVRLPADFLHDRARLVCRKWWRIIRSHAFINTHLGQHSTYGVILFGNEVPPNSVYVTATEGRIETSELSCEQMNSSTCNGLVLCVKALSLHVVNPATKQSFRLPSVSKPEFVSYYYYGAIAYSAASMEYKVTLTYYDYRDQLWLYILTVGVDNSWRRVEIPPLLERFKSILRCIPLSSEGFLHWGRESYCLTLNAETEMITMTEAPIPPHQCYDCYSYYYMSSGRYLTLLVRRGEFLWEVWEMKPAESGDHQWRRMVPNIDLENKKCWLQQDDETVDPAGWVKYPEVLVLCFLPSGKPVFYNLETRELTFGLPDRSCIAYRACVHRNSLVWLS